MPSDIDTGPTSLELAAETHGTLASSVYDRLRGDILTGILAPDEKLRTEALRVRYGVGNSPLREALNRLSVDGLVTRVDQKGFRVASASHAELEELVRTRCWLEEIALRESIAHGDAAWEERLLIAYHRLTRIKPAARAGCCSSARSSTIRGSAIASSPASSPTMPRPTATNTRRSCGRRLRAMPMARCG